MINLVYTKTFIKQVKRLDKSHLEEVVKKVELFKNPNNHKQLKVHKLHGRLSNKYAFSVNNKDRIIFQYASKNEVYLLTIENHDGYK